MSGKDGGTGVAWSKAMTWIKRPTQQFGNISTRGFVETGTDVMIGGFILGGEMEMPASWSAP